MAAHPNAAKCARAKTAIATEVGNIQGMSERFIAESTDYLVQRIPQKSFDTSEGEDPIRVRYSTAPIEEREYVDILAQGREDGTMPARNCANGTSDFDVLNINNRGASGCNLPGQTLHGGYDTFTRVLKGKAFETEPVCVMDLLLTAHFNDYLRMLRADLPRRATEHFGYSLERNVIEMARYNTSILNGFTTTEGQYPGAPQGTLDLATVRRVFNIMEAQGWTGARECTTSVEAFETMKLNYKKNTGLELQTTVNSGDTQFIDKDTVSVNWAGITWHLTKRPTRGYLTTRGDGSIEFVPVRPVKARAGTGGGIVADINEDYFNCYTYCDGERHELYEIGFYVHPTACNRQSFALPQVADKRFSNNLFNFEVKMVDGPYIDCNVDNLKFYLRLMHAYAFESLNPELMGSIIYRVSPDCIYVNDPCGCAIPEEGDPVGMAPALPQIGNACSQDDATNACDETFAAIVPAPTQDNLSPEPDEGNLRFVNVDIITETDAGSLKIWVERLAGVEGAATVVLDAATGGVSNVDGTAVADTDFTDPGNVTLSWADGEAGRKSYTLPILSGGAGEVWLKIKKGTVTGATWVGQTYAKVTIDPPFSEIP